MLKNYTVLIFVLVLFSSTWMVAADEKVAERLGECGSVMKEILGIPEEPPKNEGEPHQDRARLFRLVPN